MILWTKRRSCTVPMMSPARKRSPALRLGTNDHFCVRSSGATALPRTRKNPSRLARACQRILQAVVDHAQQARPERGGQHLAGELDLISDAHPLGLLEDLQVGAAALHPQHLALELASPVCTKATEFFIIGASLSMLTMFPVTPMTRASGVDVWHTHPEPP